MALRVRGWAAPGSVRGVFPRAWFCLNPQVGVQSSYRSVRPAWFNTDYAAAARRMNPIRQAHLRLVSEGEREGEMNIGMIVYSRTGHTLSVAMKLKEKLSIAGHMVTELTPLNWTLFRRFLVQFEGQFLLLSPLLFELGWGEIAQ